MHKSQNRSGERKEEEKRYVTATSAGQSNIGERKSVTYYENRNKEGGLAVRSPSKKQKPNSSQLASHSCFLHQHQASIPKAAGEGNVHFCVKH
jgi:hypothetical protein